MNSEIFPAWIGAAPMWGMFVMMMMALIKTWPIIQKNLLDARENRESRYGKRITELEAAVLKCREDCDMETNKLYREIQGLREQHLSEQLALVRTIVQIFPNAPQLSLLLHALESGKRSVEYMGEVLGDAQKDPSKQSER